VVPIIVIVVEALKKFKIIQDDWAPWANGILTVLGYVLVVMVDKYPAWTSTVVTALTVVTIFLTASGLYEFGKNTVETVKRSVT